MKSKLKSKTQSSKSKNKFNSKLKNLAQGSLEYLLLIGGAVLVAVIVIVLLTSMSGSSSESTKKAGEKAESSYKKLQELAGTSVAQPTNITNNSVTFEVNKKPNESALLTLTDGTTNESQKNLGPGENQAKFDELQASTEYTLTTIITSPSGTSSTDTSTVTTTGGSTTPTVNPTITENSLSASSTQNDFTVNFSCNKACNGKIMYGTSSDALNSTKEFSSSIQQNVLIDSATNAETPINAGTTYYYKACIFDASNNCSSYSDVKSIAIQTSAVCNNKICEASLGENESNCANDCKITQDLLFGCLHQNDLSSQQTYGSCNNTKTFSFIEPIEKNKITLEKSFFVADNHINQRYNDPPSAHSKFVGNKVVLTISKGTNFGNTNLEIKVDNESKPNISTDSIPISINSELTLISFNEIGEHTIQITPKGSDATEMQFKKLNFGTTSQNQGTQDTTAPGFTSTGAPTATSIDSGTKIDFTCNENCKATLEYDLSNSFETKKTVFDNELKTTHSISLTELEPGKTYYYRLIVCDASNNCFQSTTGNFQTPGELMEWNDITKFPFPQVNASMTANFVASKNIVFANGGSHEPNTYYYAKVDESGNLINNWSNPARVGETALPGNNPRFYGVHYLSGYNTESSSIYQHTSIVKDDFVYLIGGTFNGYGYYSNYYAQADGSGFITWIRASGADLPVEQSSKYATEGIRAVLVGNKIYAKSGNGGNTFFYGTIYSTTIKEDHSIEPWTTLTSTGLPAHSHGGFVTYTNSAGKIFLYYIGGRTVGTLSITYDQRNRIIEGETSVTKKVFFSEAGSTLNWIELPSLPEERSDFVAIQYKGAIYVFGGQNLAGSETSTVFKAVIDDSTGRISEWTAMQTPLLRPLRMHAGFEVKGKVYLIGGYSNSVETNYVSVASINR